ncbi:ThiF family adenylyltransferase [Dactylosporangium vinaceum]|uniref:ThiF family adenylyltransferase n=1 Tax=Dactylosporangium vinaceum TaxID=53362 RepID=A0ABV5MD38_9ACTN|nr:ThiF family adenylyltransferase [Dactylosporangium vinaceum]UAC00824.1 ThiF family adenylyltransferase [Dactylosporangium vinaceum]
METVLRLQSSYAVTHRADGVVLASLERDDRFVLKGAGPQVAEALRRLAKGVTAEQSEAELAEAAGLDPAYAGRLLTALDRRGVLVRRPRDQDLSALPGTDLYDRQVRFFGFYETQQRSGPDLNDRLQQRSVLVVGVGGLGGWLALMLARLGVRRIIAVDHDRVELSNLHRQILYGRTDIGVPKVEAARGRLCEVDDDIRYEPHELEVTDPADLAPLLDGVDLVINPFGFLPDLVRTAYAVGTAALHAGTPCLHMPGPQIVGPITIPGRTACLACVERVFEAELGLGAALSTWKASSSEGQTFMAALAPRQAISGGLAVWEATRFLAEFEPSPLLEHAISIDINAYEAHRKIKVERDVACPSCGDGMLTGA